MTSKEKVSSFCAAIVGRRKSGKTYLLSQMLRSDVYAPYRFKFIVILSPTLHLQKEFWSQIDPCGILLIVNGLDTIIMQKLIRYQAQLPGHERGHVLVCIDDVGYEARKASESKQSPLDQLAFAGRHFGISTIQLAQRWSQLSTGYRSQLDHFFFFGSSNKREISAIHEEFSPCKEVSEFRALLKTLLSKPHQVLYFENNCGRVVTCLIE